MPPRLPEQRAGVAVDPDQPRRGKRHLAEGPIAVVALLARRGVDRLLDSSGRRGWPAVASVGSGVVGAYDDLYGTTQAKASAGTCGRCVPVR